MTDYADVPQEIVERVRAVCLALPDAYEEQAWVGTRWRVRKKTFAHLLAIDSAWPVAYARAVPVTGPVTLITFRAADDELAALVNSGPPFYKPEWAPDIVGMIIGDGVDWAEVTELLTDSYCKLAPKKLAALVHQPPAP